MSIGQFKLDHLVEKNNECIIYRGSCLEENYIIILMNRVYIFHNISNHY